MTNNIVSTRLTEAAQEIARHNGELRVHVGGIAVTLYSGLYECSWLVTFLDIEQQRHNPVIVAIQQCAKHLAEKGKKKNA